MQQLYWDQCRRNAEAFVVDYLHVRDEKGEAHSFWDRFFEIFGLQRIRYANHEARVKREGNRQGFIDLLWKGKLLAEHKSASKDKEEDFTDALRQAQEYVDGLPKNDQPKKLIVCNFKRFRIYDLTDSKADASFVEVTLNDLPKRLDAFAFFPEFAELARQEEEKANLEAVQRISNVYKTLHSAGYQGHDLELLLVRILFCVFAEDTGIFEPKQFSDFIEKYTLDNGSDIGENLEELFVALNTPTRLRKYMQDDPLRAFPYVNGGLFADKLTRTPPSLAGIRNAILGCGDLFDWSQISPEIFGSLFQEALTDVERRNLGAHYTSEKNILRLLEPLFLTELREEFRNARLDRKKLEEFRKKIASLRFIDPACGCGNFLVVTYRELRMLDLETARLLQGEQGVLDISMLENVRLDNFYGIEIKPVSALIAQVALWLTKHQCNRLLNQTFHTHLKSVPIDEVAHIIEGNALTRDWNTVSDQPFDYIVGNPPFSGSKIMSDEQREEIKTLFKNLPGSGTLDYVSGWYIKAAHYMDTHPNTRSAFVSTNSIAQGEQVGMLWGTMLDQHQIQIHFAHQTFKWINEAPGVAAVFCIIVGFGRQKIKKKLLFEYADIKGEPEMSVVKNINPYLVEAGNVIISKRRTPLVNGPNISFGSMPNDGGFLILSTEEKDSLIEKEPHAAKWIHKLLSAHEFLNGKDRWCIWLVNATPSDWASLSLVNERVLAVESYRNASTREATRKLAKTPHLFGENRQPKPGSMFILVPRHSSENRKYIPLGFFSSDYIASDSCLFVPDATIYYFGLLMSEMHMAWVRYVCGRLESRYRYSNEIVYNNFPFPEQVTAAQQSAVEAAAQAVLDTRKIHQDKGLNLAKLYDPNTMPGDLLAAHQTLDRAVDACYGIKKAFATEAKRVAFLFELYEELVKGGK